MTDDFGTMPIYILQRLPVQHPEAQAWEDVAHYLSAANADAACARCTQQGARYTWRVIQLPLAACVGRYEITLKRAMAELNI